MIDTVRTPTIPDLLMRIFALPSCPALMSLAALSREAKCLALIAMVILPMTAAANPPLPPLPPVKHAGWQEECVDCHMLYHPGLLPARSWQRIMDELKSHFGRKVSIDTALRADITAFLVANAADRSHSAVSQDIAKSLAPSDRPTRISTTRWFGTAHAGIRKVDHFEQCFICHRHAQAGDFVVAH